jgi:hypothetical protein
MVEPTVRPENVAVYRWTKLDGKSSPYHGPRSTVEPNILAIPGLLDPELKVLFFIHPKIPPFSLTNCHNVFRYCKRGGDENATAISPLPPMERTA